ncbi:hypothetical protein ES703_55100 [subsurface metagenome]
MNVQEAVKFLREKVKEVRKLEKLSHTNQRVILWRNSIEYALEDVFGRNSLEYKHFYETRAKWSRLTKAQRQRKYHRQLTRRKIEILSIIEKHDREPPILPETPPKVFIAHEGETEQLSKLKEFLEALGIESFIAEAKASDGRSIEKQVDWTQAKADFAICLATKGKAINSKTGKYYMGLNIADELGRARQVFGNRIILLVQKGVEVHTNVKEIVHAPFTTQSMDKAFIKIAMELTDWGFIITGTKQGV